MTEDSAYPGFAKNLRELALEILTEKENFSVTDLQTALSVLTVTGTKDDITSIKSIDEIGSEELSIDVRTCVYEIKHAK